MTLHQLLKNITPCVKPYKWLVLAALFLTLIGSFVAQVNAWVLRYTVDTVNGLLSDGTAISDSIGILAVISAVLLGKEVINVLLQFGQRYYGEKLRIYLSRDLAQNVIQKILTYRLAFYSSSQNQPGKLQTRIDRGVENLSRLVQNFFIDILPLFANSIVALIIMFHANFYVGLLSFITAPAYYFVSRKQAQGLTKARRRIKRLRESKSQGIISIIESIPVIKSFLREQIEENKQMGLQTDLTAAQMQIRRTNFMYDGLKTFIEQIGVVGIILLTTYFVLNGTMSIGAIMFHLLLYNNVSAPIRRLHFLYDQMNDALIYAEGFFEILNSDESNKEHSGSYTPATIAGNFTLKNVNFTYPSNTAPTLFDINMNVQAGKITALVGLSGAGKSTLINLLDKFYAPDAGVIELDGIDLQEYDTDFVRKNIGLVLQKNHIFDGTVESNILYGNPNASHEEVVEAARQAYLHEQVIALPQGYESSAMSLSGGQQQKIAIARMFLKNPPIIFMDEPTASLDAIATEQIKNSMDAIKKNRTVIVISHSISQIIDSDCIYAMKDGRIVEGGTHEEIYAKHGTYKEIFDAMARSLNVGKIAKTLE